MKKRFRTEIEGWGYVFPAFTLFSIFILFPILSVFYYSFTSWNGMGDATFIGFSNYQKIFSSPEFWKSLSNNAKFLIFGVPIWTFFPLIVAVFLHEEVKGWKFFRSAYFFPTIISTAVIASLFRSFFLYTGPANSILTVFGFEAIEWFAHGNIAIGLIIFVITWIGFGSTVLIFLAGMANFSNEIFEAGELDGANFRQSFFYLTLPMLKLTLQFVVMLNVMSAFTGIFGFVFMMTGGGPGYETTVVEYLLYIKAFKLHDFGYAAALSVILFLIVVIITLIQQRITRDKDEGGLI